MHKIFQNNINKRTLILYLEIILHKYSIVLKCILVNLY